MVKWREPMIAEAEVQPSVAAKMAQLTGKKPYFRHRSGCGSRWVSGLAVRDQFPALCLAVDIPPGTMIQGYDCLPC